jgi:hypothetical protein
VVFNQVISTVTRLSVIFCAFFVRLHPQRDSGYRRGSGYAAGLRLPPRAGAGNRHGAEVAGGKGDFLAGRRCIRHKAAVISCQGGGGYHLEDG